MTRTGSKRADRQLRRVNGERKDQQERAITLAVGYVRVSTEEQTEGFGFDYQEEAIRSFAKSQGYELLDVIKDTVSGASEPDERPGFSGILQKAKDRAFDVLLVWRFDRLARHLLYAVQTVNDLQGMDVVLRSVTEPIDTATPMGQVLFSILAGMASMEREAIVERTKGGRIKKAEKGGYAGGVAPLGYRRTEKGLQAVEGEADTVRYIYQLRQEGLTLRAIAKRLTDEGYKTKRGGHWYAGTIAAILDNVRYHGFTEYVFPTAGGKHVLKPGTHEAIVTGYPLGD